MSAIRGRNTQPELIVRHYLFSLGFRYRVNDGRLPGHPDIVLPLYHTVIFINGCFWHGHEGCRYFKLPQTNKEYWKNKIERNKNRDEEVTNKLKSMGWYCITIWECQLKSENKWHTLHSIVYTLSHTYILKLTKKTYQTTTEEQSIAAEPNIKYGKNK